MRFSNTVARYRSEILKKLQESGKYCHSFVFLIFFVLFVLFVLHVPREGKRERASQKVKLNFKYNLGKVLK